jgi:CRISPR/Cas system CMR-associated protein Cmr3 (group 5 of RAMP superfamily)
VPELAEEEYKEEVVGIPLEQREKLKLEEDFYSISYLGYISENQAKYSITKYINN